MSNLEKDVALYINKATEMHSKQQEGESASEGNRSRVVSENDESSRGY